MSIVEKAGRYRGNVTGVKTGRSTNGFVQLVVSCEFNQYREEGGGKYQPLDPPQYLTGWFSVTCKDGVNKTQLDSLKRALGITSADEYFIEDALKIGKDEIREVQGVVKLEEYQGKTQARLAFINPVGGLIPNTPEEITDANDEWKRVLGGGAPPAPAEATPLLDGAPSDDVPF